ncbi:MAG: 50S ribosomal protein L13 [Candidatus Magnetoglobus multicellularis str. Araruama]|uniref:Large ribosomal subunit protein uL13 n=1 Tax=Candidatus Magnetoglobus multicellularis str. Araruama TaxID=890399 RepID=A0A1V1PHI9_9BACT|nr:MAG: 50S ribosomal protein L13 [Candidatus Magnetoglobus multicellularis str. Araruama]
MAMASGHCLEGVKSVKKYTYSAKRSDNPEKWFVVDAKDQILGRLSTTIAMRLRGKHNPLFTPHADMGDWIVVINAEKIKLTGNKLDKKMYYRHSGYIGGLKEINAKKQLEKKPEELIRHSVKGMLPKNRLGRQLFKKLKVYSGAEHPHVAQCPEPLAI